MARLWARSQDLSQGPSRRNILRNLTVKKRTDVSSIRTLKVNRAGQNVDGEGRRKEMMVVWTGSRPSDQIWGSRCQGARAQSNGVQSALGQGATAEASNLQGLFRPSKDSVQGRRHGGRESVRESCSKRLFAHIHTSLWRKPKGSRTSATLGRANHKRQLSHVLSH